MRRVFTLFAGLLCSAALFGQAGRHAPGFSLPDANGQQHDLQDYRGKIVVVEIMRSDCPNCRPFAKKLEQLKTLYAGKVAILAITNPPDTPQSVAKFVADERLTYPVLFDCGQVAYSYVRPNPLRPSINIPHLYLVDRDGIVRADYEFGPETTEIFLGSGLQKELDGLVAAKPAGKR